MTNYCVYKHTTPSQKVYIGISKNIKKRWDNNGKNYLIKQKNNKYVHYLFAPAILKYGWNNIKHEILFSNLNEISAKMIEEDLIFYYKKQNLSYNVADSAFNCNYINTAIPILQLTKNFKVVKRWNSATEAGQVLKIPSTNITHAIRNNSHCKNYYWIYESDYENIFTIKFKPIPCYIIYQLDDDKNIIKSYDYIKDAAAEFNVCDDAIGNAIKRHSKSCGYYWISQNDLNKINQIKWCLSKELSQKQGVAVKIQCISTNEIKMFSSKSEACRWLGYKSSSAIYHNPNNINGWKLIDV